MISRQIEVVLRVFFFEFVTFIVGSIFIAVVRVWAIENFAIAMGGWPGFVLLGGVDGFHWLLSSLVEVIRTTDSPVFLVLSGLLRGVWVFGNSAIAIRGVVKGSVTLAFNSVFNHIFHLGVHFSEWPVPLIVIFSLIEEFVVIILFLVEVLD